MIFFSIFIIYQEILIQKTEINFHSLNLVWVTTREERKNAQKSCIQDRLKFTMRVDNSNNTEEIPNKFRKKELLQLRNLVELNNNYYL